MTTKQESVQPKPTLLQAVVPLLGLLICLGGGYAVMKLPTQVCLLGAAAVAGFVALWIGIRWEDMLEGMIEKVMPKVKPDTNAAEVLDYLRS